MINVDIVLFRASNTDVVSGRSPSCQPEVPAESTLQPSGKF
jgi:hypothetical protein